MVRIQGPGCGLIQFVDYYAPPDGFTHGRRTSQLQDRSARFASRQLHRGFNPFQHSHFCKDIRGQSTLATGWTSIKLGGLHARDRMGRETLEVPLLRRWILDELGGWDPLVDQALPVSSSNLLGKPHAHN